MGSSYLSKGIKRTALSLALGACFVGGVQAQSNSAGAITGRAVDGDTITIVSPDTGFTRTINVSGDGSYRFSALPTGKYTITRKAADGASSSRDITVTVGTAANVDFARAAQTSAGATTLDAVQVVGSNAINPIDVSSVESTTVLTSEQIAKIPVPRNITGVALLAPGTIKGDAAFGNLASFGGSSVSENQYYVNGFNITNTFKNLNFAQIPFEAIAEQQIKTGGYGAEFGRSTGGVINLITKRGSNEFHAGGNVFWEPESLREATPNYYWNNGQLIADNSKDKGWEATASVWASGALVKDKLFAYALLQYGRTETDAYPGTENGLSFRSLNNTQTQQKSPTWLVKLDWNITDDHLLALTAFSDKRKNEREYYRTTFGDAASPTTKPGRGNYMGTVFSEEGGDNYSLKYTGYLTENFTLSALAGHGEFTRTNYAREADGTVIRYNGDLNEVVGGCPVISSSRNWRANNGNTPPPGCFMQGTLTRADAKDTRDQFRLDAEWILGDHMIRFGYDVDNFETVDGGAYSGNYQYQYNSNLSGTNQFVRRYNIRQGSTVKVEQEAFYLEDTWNITDNFLVYGGVRWDSFENKNGRGESYVKIDNQFAPRIGFSWDVNGDSSFKIFGNAGRFALPLTANVAVRGASASIYQIQDFTYTGIDPETGLPLGMAPGGGPYADPFYANGENGGPKNPSSIASTNLKPMYQDEYILGFQAQLTDHFSAGVRGVYRELKRAIDDSCDYGAILESAGFTQRFDGDDNFLGWADGSDRFAVTPNAGFPYCRLYNPGSDAVFMTDFFNTGQLTATTVKADRLGPDAKRTYSALEFFWEGAWDKFFLQGSYTYAKSKGNTEGGVKSDIGQADTGTTQDFDYPELMLGSFGYLPNDRRHTLKLFGNWDITDEWSVGGNLLIQSGRPENCFGIYGSDPANYRVAYFSCDAGEPNGLNNGNTIVDRGTVGRTPWTTTFDLNVAYRPTFADGKLAFKVDVFNLFNSDKPTSVDEEGEDDLGSPAGARNTYLTPLSWQTPRSVRFMVQYDF
jgi:TonB dependent receptor/Carboxypeptidase regulatory-like domain/TonB-dependent Receptor Plug Domain